MKKLAKVVMVALIATSGVAKADVMDVLKDYGLPCAASLAAGYLATNKDHKDHGVAIGIGVCVGVGTATYIQSGKQAQKMKEADFKQFMEMMDEHSSKAAAAQDEKVNKAIKDMEAKQASQIEAIRQVMKEVIAERMSLVGEETKGEIRRYVEKADFMQDLEKKVLSRMKEEVQLESKIRQKEVVNECVEESLRQLVLKKVGSPTE